jgi:fucose 4-O-acetylase-like acetyltransferase
MARPHQEEEPWRWWSINTLWFFGGVFISTLNLFEAAHWWSRLIWASVLAFFAVVAIHLWREHRGQRHSDSLPMLPPREGRSR